MSGTGEPDVLPHFLPQGVEFWAVNTDAQALENSLAMNKVQMGSELTRGLGKHTHPWQIPPCVLARWQDLHILNGPGTCFVTLGSKVY